MPIGLNPRDVKLYARYSQFALEMVAPIFLGIGLDLWLSTTPWLTLVGVGLSLLVMILRLNRLLHLEERPK